MYSLENMMYDERHLKSSKKGSIFSNLVFYDQNIHKLEDFQLAIVGLDKSSFQAFRNTFYLYGDHFQFPILDLGMLKGDQITERLDMIADKLPLIVIGGKPQELTGNTCIISKDLTDNKGNNPVLAYQRHLASLDSFNQRDMYQNLSLGEIRKNIQAVEPIIRTCQNLSVRLDAIKLADLGIEADNICGLTLEECAQICRYVGFTQGMRIMHFPNLQPQFAYGNMQKEYAECVSTMLWYFLEGLLNLSYMSPEEDDHISYVVETEYFEESLTFLKGERSGKWWMKYGENSEFVPCMYEDFVSTKEGNVPEKVFKFCQS